MRLRVHSRRRPTSSPAPPSCFRVGHRAVPQHHRTPEASTRPPGRPRRLPRRRVRLPGSAIARGTPGAGCWPAPGTYSWWRGFAAHWMGRRAEICRALDEKPQDVLARVEQRLYPADDDKLGPGSVKLDSVASGVPPGAPALRRSVGRLSHHARPPVRPLLTTILTRPAAVPLTPSCSSQVRSTPARDLRKIQSKSSERPLTCGFPRIRVFDWSG